MADARHLPCIYVLAGTNGAGKSSIAGAMLRESGADYFNPDEAAHRFRQTIPALSQEQANSEAWRQGVRLLERAVAERLDFAFETTLGGSTITALLQKAMARKIAVRIWYVGLATPELHIARVQTRVASGGHNIPESAIRYRFNASRLNLILLLPKLTELRLFDNSRESDPRTGRMPLPELLLHMKQSRIIHISHLQGIPDWARPIVAAALKLSPPRSAN